MQWERLNYWKILICFFEKGIYLCDCAHPPVFVITSLTDYDVDPPAMPPMHACLNEMSHSWFIVEYENSCIFVFVNLCFCDTFPQRMLAWINWWMKCHLRHMIHWPSGGLCVFWYYQKKNTLNEKLSVFVIYAAIRSLTNNYSNNLFLSLDMNGIVDATGIASDYNTTACKSWFRVLIIKLFFFCSRFFSIVGRLGVRGWNVNKRRINIAE